MSLTKHGFLIWIRIRLHFWALFCHFHSCFCKPAALLAERLLCSWKSIGSVHFKKREVNSNTPKAALPTCAAQRYRSVGYPCAAPAPPKVGKDRRSGCCHPSKVLAKAMEQICFSTDNNGIIYFLPKAGMVTRPDYISQNKIFYFPCSWHTAPSLVSIVLLSGFKCLEEWVPCVHFTCSYDASA